MAIAKIKKLEIIGLERDRDSLLILLQKLAIVEIIQPKDQPLNSSHSVYDLHDSEVLGLNEAINFLSSFKEKAGFLESMVKLKPLVYYQQWQEVIDSFNYKKMISDLNGLRNQLKDLHQNKEKLQTQKHLLDKWQTFSIPLDKNHSTKYCGIILGILRLKDYDNFINDCNKHKLELFYEIINQDKANVYLAIVYLNHQFENLEILLKNHRFNPVSFLKYNATVKERINQIEEELLTLEEDIKIVKDKILEFVPQQFNLMVIYDHLNNLKNRYSTEKKLAKQTFTFKLEGWIKNVDILQLKAEIEDKFKELVIFISEPEKNSDIPIALENKPTLAPFEVVTNLYGQPIYSGLDPSSFLAPFFAFSFGFCMMDAGYGLILLVIMLYFLGKKQISIHGKKFLRLFLFMSIATILAGVVTGSFFGDLISRLPDQFSAIKNIQKKLTLFDPVKDSLLFLGLTLAFGFIQIWTGVFIKFLADLKKDKFTAWVLDLPTLLVQSSLLIMVLTFSKVLPKNTLIYSGILLLISSLTIIYYQWKSNPEISLKMFWAIFGIYSVITGNFLADTLSFSRIFALGLTGSLLGMAINTMLFPKNFSLGFVSILGTIIAVIALFLSHLINLAIGLLGAYVHTSRLQYLEFFGKFFEGGGRPFKPFKQENQYIFLAKEGSFATNK